MAFSVTGTTAGVGTVSVAANSLVVTGVGTSFSVNDVGRIIQIGSTFAVGGVIRDFVSATEVRLDRPITTAQTGQGWRFVNQITQSGTDTNPSAITTAVPGVNAVIDTGGTFATNYEMGLTQLVLNGVLTVPDGNFLRWAGNRDRLQATNLLAINNGGEIIIDGRYTITRRGTMLTGTASTSGTTMTGTGTLFTKELTVGQWVNDGTNARQVSAIASDTSLTLATAFPSNLNNINIFALPVGTSTMTSTVYSLNCGLIMRHRSSWPFSHNGTLVQGGARFTQFGGVFESQTTIRFADSTSTVLTLRDAVWRVYDRSGHGYMNVYMPISKIDADGWIFMSNGTASPGFLRALDAGFSIRRYQPIGCAAGLDPIDGQTAKVDLTGYAGGGSAFDFKFRLGGTVQGDGGANPGGFDFFDATLGNNMTSVGQGASQNTGRARHFLTYAPTFLSSAAGNSAINGGILYLADTNSGARRTTNGVPGGKTYIATTGATGATASQSLLTGVWTGDGTNAYPYFDNRLPVSGFMWAYGFSGLSVNITSSIGPQRPTLFAPVDANVTLSATAAAALLGTKFTVTPGTQTVTVLANANYDELYDALKAYKCTAVQTNLETPSVDRMIVTPSGSSLTAFTGWTLVVNSGVTLAAGTKFTFLSFQTITNNGTITGIYGTSAGVSSILELREVSNDSAYIIANNSTKATILFGTNSSGSTQTYRAYFPPGSAGLQVLVAREKYGIQRQQEVITLANGLMWYTFVDIPDVGISEPTQATVAAYTSIENADKFYDRTAVFRLTEAGIKLGQITVRDGTAVRVVGYNVVINQSAANVYAIGGTTITLKATGYANGTKFTNTVLDNTRTLTANTNEVLSADFEDANGDSGVTILGGDGTFELWKITTSTATADYQTGTKLTSPTIGNTRYRFIGVSGFDIVGVDINSNVRRRTSMAKGVYTQSFYVGDQIQLAQAPVVNEINDKVDLLKVDIAAVQAKTDGLTFTVPNVLDANIQYVNDIEVKGTGEENDPWNPV